MLFLLLQVLCTLRTPRCNNVNREVLAENQISHHRLQGALAQAGVEENRSCVIICPRRPAILANLQLGVGPALLFQLGV